MVHNILNSRYNMKLATNSGARIIEKEVDETGFGKVMLSRY